MKRNKVFALLLSLIVVGGAASAMAGFVQDAIEASAVGDIVRIPAGVYNEVIVLKEGITLYGEGADVTTIDGGGADVVVRGGKNSAIAGFTVQNGKIGVYNAHNFIGVFDCIVQDVSVSCVKVTMGSAIVANNLLLGKGDKSSGIVSARANPVITGNVIAEHKWTGILGAENHVLTVSGNVIARNMTGVRCMNGAEAILEGNVFWENKQDVRNVEMSDTDIVREVDLDAAIPYRAIPPVDMIVAEMDRVHNLVVAEHPSLIYTLSDELGQFNVTTLHPWATFTVAASARDTVIDAYAAHDLVEPKEINACFQAKPVPLVAVKNPMLLEKETERYAMAATYVHPASYAAGEGSQIVFNRLASFSKIKIILPAGYDVVSLNYPYAVGSTGDRVSVDIVDIGDTFIELVMAPVSLGGGVPD